MAHSSFDPRALARKPTRSSATGWQQTAFLAEALIILVVLLVCIAVFARLFSYAYHSNPTSSQQAHAITLATNQAERFSAETQSYLGEQITQEDGYTVRTTVESEETGRGTLYHATVEVAYGQTQLYQLSSARYVSNALESAPATENGEGGDYHGQN